MFGITVTDDGIEATNIPIVEDSFSFSFMQVSASSVNYATLAVLVVIALAAAIVFKKKQEKEAMTDELREALLKKEEFSA